MKKSLAIILVLLTISIVAHTQSVPSYVPANGLVGWWPFNGNANDESGNGNNGTPNGTISQPDRFGTPNSAYEFNGTSSKIDLSNNNIPIGNSSRSISLWFKMDVPATNIYASLVRLGNNSTGQRSGLAYDGSNQLLVEFVLSYVAIQIGRAHV